MEQAMNNRSIGKNPSSIKRTHTDAKIAYTQPEFSCRIYDVSCCKFRTNKNTESLKEEKAMEKESIREIISTVFKALTLAMGVAVVVLSCLGSLETQTAVTMLGIGLACAGVVMLEKR